MNFHILNGDSLAQTFAETGIAGEVIVFREALIDGDLSGNNLHQFWQARARYIGLSAAEYHDKVVREVEKLLAAEEGSEFNLWFEYDLFCQVNLWFILSLLQGKMSRKKVFVVYTSHLRHGDKDFWNGFGPATSQELAGCFSQKTLVSDDDLELGSNLWSAYKDGDLESLGLYSRSNSPSFPYLAEVIEAQADRLPRDGRQGRPERVLEEIIKNGTGDFNKVFQEFWKRENIYGFGDVQLKRLYDKVLQNRSDSR